MTAKKMLCLAGCLAAMSVGLSSVHGDDDSTKPTIKSIMAKDNKGDDCVAKRATAGKATADEIAGMLADYKAMAKMEPPKGDLESWKAKTAKLVEATEALKPNDKASAAAFKAAVDCRACHSVHKPAKKPA